MEIASLLAVRHNAQEYLKEDLIYLIAFGSFGLGFSSNILTKHFLTRFKERVRNIVENSTKGGDQQATDNNPQKSCKLSGEAIWQVRRGPNPCHTCHIEYFFLFYSILTAGGGSLGAQVEPVEPCVLGLIRLLCLAVAQSGCPNWTLVQGKQPSRVIISYDTLGRHIPLTGWRAIPVFFLTENVAQLSREPNPRLEKMIKSKYYVSTIACA